MTDHFDVLVIGGGLVGLSVAWRTASRGLRVAVVDPAPTSGASHAAAGMLAPVSEVTYTEEPLLQLGLASLARWPAFAAELAEGSGHDLDYRTDGTLDVAFGSDDLAALDELATFIEKLGLPARRLTGRECRRLEPMLTPSVRGGLLAGGDAWVDPRRVTAALLAALERQGGALVRSRVSGLEVSRETVTGVRLATGEPVGADRVILAAGAWSGELEGLPPEVLPPVRPIKGQIMRLRSPRRSSSSACAASCTARTSIWCRAATGSWSSGPPRRRWASTPGSPPEGSGSCCATRGSSSPA
ncbi:FAD-dependent oxidoreductase [Streptosporangium lutulentum]